MKTESHEKEQGLAQVRGVFGEGGAPAVSVGACMRRAGLGPMGPWAFPHEGLGAIGMLPGANGPD